MLKRSGCCSWTRPPPLSTPRQTQSSDDHPEEFRECTVISISHCVPTVMDSDRVLVLDAGLVKEFDAPSKLMGRPSVFRRWFRSTRAARRRQPTDDVHVYLAKDERK
ncbi:hypothetical protein ZWY2020_006717 [Hordeum vulgare]|nr:hypothetical protein ZWY2020_006717 [Hordeum vulgare]